MTDTPFKRITTPLDHEPASPSAASWPSELLRAAFGKPLRSQDTIFGARRQLFCSHTGGSAQWLAENVAVNPAAQNQPGDAERVIARGRCEIAPGQSLELRAITVPGGPIVRFVPGTGEWTALGFGGEIRLTVDYDNVETETDQVLVSRHCPASDLPDGLEPEGFGGSWLLLKHHFAPAIRPGAAASSPDQARRWCEWPTATFTLSHKGSVRCVSLNVCEVPSEHVVPHDSDATTLHDYPVEQGQQHPDAYPQTDQVDGATYEERRFGTRRGLLVAERQTERLGPGGICWSSWAEGTTEVTDTESDPFQYSSSAWRRISVGENTGQTAWDANAAGFDLSACYARRAPENLRSRLSGAATVPVRARVYARATSAGSSSARIKFASSSRSEIIVTIPQVATYAWYTATGWLETTVAPDDEYPVLQDFASVGSGMVLQVRAWQVMTGEFSVGT